MGPRNLTTLSSSNVSDGTDLTTLSSSNVSDGTDLTIVKATLYSFIMVLGVFGNILVVKATSHFLTLRRPTNILICNLCICDILIMLLGIPMFVVGEHRLVAYLGITVCKILHPLLVGSLTATVFTLVTIAIERCDVIVNSVRSKLALTTKKAFYIVAGLDTLALVFSLPLCFSNFKRDSLRCTRDWTPAENIVYAVTLFLVQYFIPLIVMGLLYSICWHKIRKKNKATIEISNTNRRNSFRGRSRSEGDVLEASSAEEGEGDELLPTAPPASYLSGSRNHLSGKRNSVRRSFSADSVYDLQSGKRNSKRYSTYHRKSVNYEAIENKLQSKERPVSFCGSRASFSGVSNLKPRNSLLVNSRQSLRGSVQKLQQSLTTLIIGADGIDALTAFAVKRVKQTLKTLKVFSCILIVFALCMLPHHVVSFMYDDVSQIASFLQIFIYVNAAVNPWIYAGMNKSYRLAYTTMFRRKKPKTVSQMMQNNLFSRPKSSGSFLSNHKNSAVHTLCWLKFMNCLCGKFCKSRQDYYDGDGEVMEACLERRDTLKSLDGNFFSTRRGSRKGSRLGSIGSRKDSKTSRKASTVSEDDHIPVLAPIIIITCYDDEIAMQEELAQEAMQRFSLYSD